MTTSRYNRLRHARAALIALGLTFLPALAAAQPISPACESNGPGRPLPPAVVQGCETLKAQIAGVWTLTAYEKKMRDGQIVTPLGANPRGTLL